jgi:hypothetical protein
MIAPRVSRAEDAVDEEDRRSVQEAQEDVKSNARNI